MNSSIDFRALRSVAIRLPNWVGDAVMAVPALRELRRMFSQSRIIAVGRPSVLGLIEDEGIADQAFALGETAGPIDRVRRFRADVRGLRRHHIELGVLLPNSFESALLFRAARARVAGYTTDKRRALIHLPVQFESNHKSRHQVRYYLNIAAELERKLVGASSIVTADVAPTLCVSASRRQQAAEFLAAAGIHSRAPIVCLSPGATNSRAKRWLAERFAHTADSLSQRDGSQVVLIGTSADRDVAAAVAQQMSAPATVLAGKTDVAQLKGVLSCCSLLVSNDNGAAHIAAALGVPTAVIFGPTEHQSTRPLNPAVTIIRHNVECSPCMLRDCPIDHRCMTGVQVEEVYGACQGLLVSNPLGGQVRISR